jgi:hypothetical protein
MKTNMPPGVAPAKTNATVKVLSYAGVLALVIVGQALIWWGSRATVDSQMIRDAQRQWAIVSKGDDALAKSIHAGALAQAYLMAGRENEYNEWKSVANKWQRVAFGDGR